MFSLFFPSNTELPFEGIRHQTSLDNPLSLYRRDLERTIQYYRNTAKYVSNNHILVRAISLMVGDLSLSPEDYYDVSVQKAYSISKHLQFTTSVQQGEVTNGRFYNGSRELIISTVSYLSPFSTEWEHWQPVKVRYHERNYLDYNLPLLKQTETVNDLVVLEIDLPMLSLQYYHYYKRQLLTRDSNLIGFGYFIARYVLPNMLYTQADRQLLNRIKYLFYTQKETKSLFKQPFFTTDYNNAIDRELLKLVGLIGFSSKGYETLLLEIPGVFTTASTAFMLNASAPTRQIKWAWWLSRKQDIDFIKDFFGRSGVSRNRSYWTEYHLFKRDIETTNILSTVKL